MGKKYRVVWKRKHYKSDPSGMRTWQISPELSKAEAARWVRKYKTAPAAIKGSVRMGLAKRPRRKNKRMANPFMLPFRF